jgi:hypothetical protein
MSKFDSVMAEAAHVIHAHGFAADEFGSSVEGAGWNGLVTVSAPVLLNLGENELRDRFVAEHSDTVGGFLVWIQEDTQGFVSVVEFGSDEGTRSSTDLVNQAFDAANAAQDTDETDGPDGTDN